MNYNPVNLPNEEMYYRASRFSESLSLMGYAVKYTPCLSFELNNQGDPVNMQYGERVDTFISILELNRLTLEKRGWITEDTPIVADISEILFKPYLEYRNSDRTDKDVSEFLLPIGRYSLIEIPYKFATDEYSAYRVMDIYADDTRPMIWECKLAPVRGQTDADTTTPEVDHYRTNQIGKVMILDESGDDTETLENFK